MRRFPTIPQVELGFEGAHMTFLIGGCIFLGSAIVVARYLTEDRNIEESIKHHPKGIGYTGINKQKDFLRKMTKKISPNLDEHYYEYSRHNPMPHR